MSHPIAPLRFLLPVIVLTSSRLDGHGDLHENIQRSDARIAADPGNAGHWFQRAKLECRHGDWMRALTDLETAERLAPGKYPVELARGQAWMAGDKLPQARKALDAFVKSHPAVAEGHATRARLRMKLGDPDAAAADFQQALTLTTEPEPDLYLETANALIAATRPGDAVKQLDAGMTKLGIIPSLAEKAVALELSLGACDAALARVAELQRTSPRPEPWMAKRAEILAQAGRLNESRAAWRELRDHLLALPDPERNSRSMSRLLEQCQQALAVPPTHP